MDIISLLFNKTITAGLIVGILSLYAISREESDLHVLLLSDIVEYAMLVIIAAIGTDLAEALILPGLVVGMAELLAVSEILTARNELRKNGANLKKRSKLFEEFTIKESPKIDVQFNKLEVLSAAPKFLSFILIIYGAILTGFTGGAIMASGLLFYIFSQRALDNKILPEDLKVYWEGISGFSGIAWVLWIFGFMGFFIFPEKWLYFTLLAGFALTLKVGSKLGLIGEIFE